MGKNEIISLFKIKKERKYNAGKELWKFETPLDIVSYDFIKCLERNIKDLSFEAVKNVDGRLVLYFVKKKK